MVPRSIFLSPLFLWDASLVWLNLNIDSSALGSHDFQMHAKYSTEKYG